MSDSRFNLTGNFRIYGKDFPFDMSLNWFSQDQNEIDRRITEFFLHTHDEAHLKWRQDAEDSRTRYEHEQNELREKAELERLRAKYGDA